MGPICLLSQRSKTKIMRFLFVILILFLFGCGDGPWLGLGDTEKRTKIEKESKEKRNESFDGRLSADYPAPSHQNINLNVSGNAKVDMKLPAISTDGRVIWNTDQKNTMKKVSTESFSIDEYIKTVSTAGWALLFVCLSVLIITVIIFLRKTIIGRAADAAIGASIKYSQRTISELSNKLMHMNPNTDGWNSVNEVLKKNEEELGHLLAKQKPGKR